MTGTPLEAFKTAIANAGYTPPDTIIPGAIQRFSPTGKRGDTAGWYRFFDDGVPAGVFGNWRDSSQITWSAKPVHEMTDAERDANRLRMESARQQRDEAKAAQQEATAKAAQKRWEAATLATDHPYIQNKDIAPHGVRIDGEILLIPGFDVDGRLWTLQKIDANGEKRFLHGGRVSGCFFTIGDLDSAEAIVVAEGFATAATCFETTWIPTIAAFSAGNLLEVSKEIREKYPEKRIILAADDDWKRAGNPGMTKATEAAKSISGWLAKPLFPADKPRSDKDADFNDLIKLAGPEAVVASFDKAVYCDPQEKTQAPPPDDVWDAMQHDDGTQEPQPTGYPLSIVFADDLSTEYEPVDELIEDVITAEDGSVLYGDSNSGKTFLAIDMAAAVARGVEWMGKKTEKGAVLYLAAESPSSVRRRLQAYQKHHGCTVPNFAIVQNTIDLFSSDKDANKIIALVRQLEAERGVKVRLIVGDTLARLSAGANENTGQDMGLVVRRFDRIRLEAKAHFLLIHHSGKNAAAGSRGWSGVRGAIETEIEVQDAISGRVAEITKQRDLPTKGDRIGFRLEPVTLGLTKWGKPATSCIVVAADAPAKPQGKRMGAVEGAVVEFLAAHKVGIRKSEVAKHFDGRYDRSNVYRAIRNLVTAQAVHEAAGMVCISEAAK